MRGDEIWGGTPSIRGESEFTRMSLLTFSLVGLQLCWGLEMTYCMPYLLELGLTKSKTSLVWIAGPLSGLIVAPIVGAVADRSTNTWGRRRPFMITSSVVVALLFFVLAWAAEIVALFIRDPKTVRDKRDSAFRKATSTKLISQAKNYTIVLAVGSIYAIDFAINVVQWTGRAIIVDTLPASKQQSGSAWAGRMTAIGHLFGYLIGALDLKTLLGTTLGSTQFKQLTVISAFSLVTCTAITCWGVTERYLISSDSKQATGLVGTVVSVFSELYTTTLHMPARIAGICAIQFWAWIAWFPFLFYSSTWVGETYFTYDHPTHAKAESSDKSGDIGRIGSTALLVFSVITLAASIVLPWLIRSPEDGQKSPYTPRPPPKLGALIKMFHDNKPSLTTAYFVSHLVFAGALFLAPFVRSFRFATLLVALSGVPWALAQWAPYAFLGVEVNRLSQLGPEQNGGNGLGESPPTTPRDLRDGVRLNLLNSFDADDPLGNEEEHETKGQLSGVYLGILNLFTTLPQFVGTFISMIVFRIFESHASGKATHGSSDDTGPMGIAVCLFIGACSSLVAASATLRLKYIR